MKPEEKAWINHRYNKRIAEKGFNIDGLAAGNVQRRELRYQILEEVGIISGSSVLDVGCGLGDFGLYLRKKGLDVSYTGIDINQGLIEECRRRHKWGNFFVADIEEDNLQHYDFVVSSSCFNLKLQYEGNYGRMASLLSAMYAHMNKAVACDMLSSWVDFRGNPVDAFYYDPAEVFAISKKITKSVQLRHDYPLFEFCVYLFPDFEGWLSSAPASDV